MAKYRKIKNPENSRAYKKEVINLALSYMPQIYPCAKCGHPVIDGWCCSTCGTTTPDEK